MGWLDQVGGLLQQYSGQSAAAPPASTQQDFNRVSQAAPSSDIASALAHAFRSDQTPPFSTMVGGLFGQSDGTQKAGLINQLLAAAPGLSGLLGGQSTVTPEQAQQISPETVQQAAEHAETQSPGIVDQISSFYSQHPTLVQGLGAGTLALMMSRMSNRS